MVAETDGDERRLDGPVRDDRGAGTGRLHRPQNVRLAMTLIVIFVLALLVITAVDGRRW